MLILNSQKEFGIGTLVLRTTQHCPFYGIVVDRDHWIAEAKKEDPSEAECFKKLEKEHGEEHMIPIFVFGEIFGHRSVINQSENESYRKLYPRLEKPYVKRYAWSNVGGEIMTIPGIHHLRDTINQAMLFGGKSRYLEDVKFELFALETFFSGKYKIGHSGNNPNVEHLIWIFEEALPRDKISITVLESLRLGR